VKTEPWYTIGICGVNLVCILIWLLVNYVMQGFEGS